MATLGVIGTMVWDTIHRRDPGRSAPVEEWGGIAYALSAFEAAPPAGWKLLPILKVGADLSERAGRFLARLTTVASLDGVRTVPERNNRVTLQYRDGGRRCERLTGGVPGWAWEELGPLVSRCDAVYVNFIAGWELDLTGARALRSAFAGPTYVDIHSLTLGIGPDGVRHRRPLPDWRAWIACFDLVQTNEDELAMLAGPGGDPLRVVAEVVGPRTRAIFVTLGERGVAWVAEAGFERLGSPARREGLSATGGAVSGVLAPPRRVSDPDPTGCGDVWGITCFAALLGGAEMREAMGKANELAARNAGLRGASDLAMLLRSERSVLRDGRE